MSEAEPLDTDGELLAAEAAFGLLDPVERAAAADRRIADRGFAEAVQRWTALAAELLTEDDAAEVPDARVWSGIVDAIGAADRDDEPLRRAVRRWRALALVASAVAAALVAVIVARPPQPVLPPPSSPPLLAVLKGERGPAAGAISYDVAAHRITAQLEGVVTGGRIPVLWVIGDDGVPYALSVVRIARASSNVAAADNASRLASGVQLAVSLEPGNRPIAPAPTGPVIVTGKLL